MSKLHGDRRSFIRAMIAAGGAASGLMPSIARALDIPAHRRTGTIVDVEHVVILTQENRSFDHYFGTLSGVRGFGDRFVLPALAQDGAASRTIFVQPDETPGTGRVVTPFHLDTARDFRLIRVAGTPHTLPDAQAAWDEGRMSAWPQAKHNHAMGYFTRADIPFQFALAEAFTICDAYHCSFHGGTNPNRLFIWTATNDPSGRANGPAIDNSYDNFVDPFGHGGYRWGTYPERLQAAGVSFQIYQDMADNFEDNPLPGFQAYRAARSATGGRLRDLADRTIATRDLDLLRADVEQGRLPQVSWIVAPARFSEHPVPSSPLQGAEYTARVLDALTANPDIWSKTVLLLNFDENDGLFDHVPPPAAPARDPRDPSILLGSSTVPVDDEYHVHAQDDRDRPYLHRPYGLGPRVPLYVISPWSRGGYVSSEVFDHTSVIRFLETRFGVAEPNISPWRRAVCGDLTSCFDFAHRDDDAFVGALPTTQPMAARAATLPQFQPDIPFGATPPVQERGLRPRRATPYDLEAELARDAQGGLALRLSNRGRDRAAVFHVYDVGDLAATPRRHMIGAGHSVDAPLPARDDGRFDIFLLGPNGFHRRLTGKGGAVSARLDARRGPAAARLRIARLGGKASQVVVRDSAYGAPERRARLSSGGRTEIMLDLTASHGWYDLIVDHGDGEVRLAGHVETGAASYSDPAAFGPAPLLFDAPDGRAA